MHLQKNNFLGLLNIVDNFNRYVKQIWGIQDYDKKTSVHVKKLNIYLFNCYRYII